MDWEHVSRPDFRLHDGCIQVCQSLVRASNGTIIMYRRMQQCLHDARLILRNFLLTESRLTSFSLIWRCSLPCYDHWQPPYRMISCQAESAGAWVLFMPKSCFPCRLPVLWASLTCSNTKRATLCYSGLATCTVSFSVLKMGRGTMSRPRSSSCSRYCSAFFMDSATWFGVPATTTCTASTLGYESTAKLLAERAPDDLEPA